MTVNLLSLGFTENNTTGDVLRCLPKSMHTQIYEQLKIQSLRSTLSTEQLNTSYAFFDKLVFESLLSADQIAEQVKHKPLICKNNFVSAAPIVAARLSAELAARKKKRKSPKLFFALDDEIPKICPVKSKRKIERKISSVITDVCKFLPTSWIPSKLTIRVKSGPGVKALQKGDTIHLPGRFDIEGLVKHPQTNLAILAHEFGHDIVDELMSMIFPEWKRNVDKLKQSDLLRAESKEMYKQYHQLNNEKRSLTKQGASSEIIKAVSERADEAYAEWSKKGQQADILLEETLQTNFQSRFGPYNELLADLIAVIWSQDKDGEYDPRVIYDATYSPHLDSKESNKKMRHERRINEWRDWSQKCSVKGWKEKQSHIALNPVRSHLWDQYLTTAWARHHPKEMLVNVVEAVVKAYQDRYHNGQIESISSEEMNRSLIAHIDKIMATR